MCACSACIIVLHLNTISISVPVETHEQHNDTWLLCNNLIDGVNSIEDEDTFIENKDSFIEDEDHMTDDFVSAIATYMHNC